MPEQTEEEKVEERSFLRFMNTTSKLVIWICIITSTVWISLSYVLAFIGREQIAESLSSNVCTVVVGQVIAYFVTKTTENIFRYNPKLGGASEYYEDVAARMEHQNTAEEPPDAGTVDG